MVRFNMEAPINGEALKAGEPEASNPRSQNGRGEVTRAQRPAGKRNASLSTEGLPTPDSFVKKYYSENYSI
jgi:hypothetical protein